MADSLAIDGSHGEGGGQIIRSSLALALVTGQPFSMHSIRAGRSKPGLMRQHLTAVQAAQQVGQAQLDGAAIGSRQVTFSPATIVPGDYGFRIGTAGSTTLVLQTVLPALMLANGPSRLTLEGGTHNPFAPPFDFFEQTYLPLLNRMGPNISARLERSGFYPAGGGRLVVDIVPTASLGPIELLSRGELQSRKARALIANLPRHIAEREVRTLDRTLSWESSELVVEEVHDSPGPGNVVIAQLQYANLTEVFTAFGQKGVAAENVAGKVAKAVRGYQEVDAPVGEYLADQLMLPLGIGAWQGTGGGVFRTHLLSGHAQTHLEVLRQFLPEIRVEANRQGRDDWLVRIGAE